MSRYDVCKLLVEAYSIAELIKEGKRVLELNDSQKKAVNLLLDVLKARAKIPLGGVQGPPGTGKTTVIENFVYDKISDEIYNIDGLIVYIAPTNHLAAQAFQRVSAALLAKDYTFNDLTDMIRLYGSKITVSNCDKLFELHKIKTAPPLHAVKRIVNGNIDPDRVKIVFATEYQRVSGKYVKKPNRTYLIVDEASKSPYYRAFISLADSILRYEDYPQTLVALGDPEQAITVPEAFRFRRVPLLMHKIKYLLANYGRKDYYIMLDTTYRLPEPSQEPISVGFYSNMLHAYETAEWRLKFIAEMFNDMASKAKELIKQEFRWNTRIETLFNSIYSAISTFKPIVIIQTKVFESASKATTYDRPRTNLGILSALILEAFLTAAERSGSYNLPSVMVTAPYSDIVTNVSFNYRQKFGTRFRQPKVATVHAVIGGEADFVVTILGKEYAGGSYRESFWRTEDLYKTMYFNEPQVLNVQLSRHHKLLIVIGAVDKLAYPKTATYRRSSYADARLSKTAKKLLDLAEKGDAIMVKV